MNTTQNWPISQENAFLTISNISGWQTFNNGSGVTDDVLSQMLLNWQNNGQHYSMNGIFVNNIEDLKVISYTCSVQ